MKIKKINQSEFPEAYDAASWNEWALGGDNVGLKKSLPIDYEVEGSLVYPIEVGKAVVMNRTHRNGVQALGTFISSPVVHLDEERKIFTTQNSIYTYE